MEVFISMTPATIIRARHDGEPGLFMSVLPQYQYCCVGVVLHLLEQRGNSKLIPDHAYPPLPSPHLSMSFAVWRVSREEVQRGVGAQHVPLYLRHDLRVLSCITA